MKKKSTRPIRLNSENVRPLDIAPGHVAGNGSFVESVRICVTFLPTLTLNC
jgi:hypothetical protein